MSGHRWIRALLRLYPRSFRARYADELLAFHAQRSREGGRMRSTVRVTTDHLTSAAREWARVLTTFDERHPLGDVWSDVRYAMRGLRRQPAFAAVVLITIALGVGANAAIFSVVDGVLIRPLPYPRSEQLVVFGHEPTQWLTSPPEYFDYKRDIAAFSSLSMYTMSDGTIDGAAEPERVSLARVTMDFFTTMGVVPRVGRTFTGEEDLPAPAKVVIISHDLWQRRFAGDSAIVGKTIRLNAIDRTIIGVMPPRFGYPKKQTAIWLPYPRLNPDSLTGQRSNHFFFGIGRLRPDATLERAKLEASTAAKRMMQVYPQDFDPQRPLIPKLDRLSDNLLGKTRPYLIALFGAVAFVLLIACANVANLLLSRGEDRHREIAVRTAIGASRLRVVRQLLIEALLLGAIGGTLGLGLGIAGSRVLVALAPAEIPRLDEVGMDWRVLTFTLLASLATALVFGLAPALRAGRVAPMDAIKEGGRAHAAGTRARAMRRALVAAEVALAVTLLGGSGMLLRSLWNLQRSELGFDERGVLTANISLLAQQYPDPKSALFFSQLQDRLEGMPGVRAVGASGWLPVVDAGGLWGVAAEGVDYRTTQMPNAAPQQITPGWFAAMGMPIRMGRGFTAEDRAETEPVTIISKSMTKLMWGDTVQNPVGKRFRLGGGQVFMTVVGVVDDIRARGFGDTPEPTMYFPYAQTGRSAYFMPKSMTLAIRTDGNPLALERRLRNAVRELDASAPVARVRTMETVVGTSVSTRRFGTALIAGFAVLALVLAGIGIFGVISYGVSQRRYEIGLRMALGAERGRILSLVAAEGLAQSLVGVAIGMAGAAAVARAIRAMLVDAPTLDVPALVVASLLLGVVGTVAAIVPARRAMKVQPTDALRG